MPYVRLSPEAILGGWAESTAARWCMGQGWHVLHTAEIGTGATMVIGPDGNKVIMPDLQLFDLIRGRKSRLVEVKAKRGAYRYNKLQIDCTGIDRPKWEAHRRINDAGVPVDLAIIHLHWPLRSSPQLAPKLFWQTMDALGQPMTFDNARFPHGAAVWEMSAFDFLGDLPTPPPHIVTAIQAIDRNFRIWEKPATKIRRPRKVPGQYELFP